MDEDELTQEQQSELQILMETLQEQSNAISEVVENEVRQSFGHYEKGNRWTSETILYQLVESQYSEYTIRRHHRPEFLEGLELDIYIEEEDIAIEYQGVQHYEPVEHWRGEEGLKKRQERDEKKKRLCKENDIKLVYFRYDEELSEEIVQRKINRV
jgi:hypothetical protein